MLKTYTFYLRDSGQTDRFVPAMCATDAEAIRRGRILLADHPECETVEVVFDNSLLFTIDRA